MKMFRAFIKAYLLHHYLHKKKLEITQLHYNRSHLMLCAYCAAIKEGTLRKKGKSVAVKRSRWLLPATEIMDDFNFLCNFLYFLNFLQ